MESESGWRLWIADVALWGFGRGPLRLSPAPAGWHRVESEPGPDSLVSWGLAKACVPGGAREEMERERGGKARAQRQAPKPQLQQQPCLCLPLPFLSPHFTKQGNWPGTLPSSAINQRERRGVVCASVCVCADRELAGTGVVVWRPGPPNKAEEFTQRANEGGREGGREADRRKSLVHRLRLCQQERD
ncbi:hypothetical protein MHYP_G00198140 [Metynnis hypsauchen]